MRQLWAASPQDTVATTVAEKTPKFSYSKILEQEQQQRKLTDQDVVPVPDGQPVLQLESHELIEVSHLQHLMEQCGYSFIGVGVAQILVTVLEASGPVCTLFLLSMFLRRNLQEGPSSVTSFSTDISERCRPLY